MKRISIVAAVVLIFPALVLAGPGGAAPPAGVSPPPSSGAIPETITQPENLPQTIPATAASLYRLMFELDRGMPYRELVRMVPNAYTVREPGDVVGACRRLGLKAEHKKARVSDVLVTPGPFLVRNREGNWMLYRVRNGVIQRLDGSSQAGTGVPESEFLQDWTGDVITVEAYTAEDYEQAPRIEFSETQHDFGQAWQGDNLTHLFTFKNTGSSPLEITNIRASCGCTAAVVSKIETPEGGEGQSTSEARENPGPGTGPVAGPGTGNATLPPQAHHQPGSKHTFAPGESGNIEVTFRTAGKRSRTGSTVTVYSNDPRSPTTMLRVSAMVMVPVEVQPSIVRLNRVGKGSDLQREVRIRAPNDPDFEIQSVHGNNEKVSWTLQPVHEGSDQQRIPSYVLKISIDIEGANVGTTIRDTLVLKTSSEAKPVISIPVEATIVGDLYLAPAALNFTGNYPNRDLVRYAMLRNNSVRDVSIVEVRNEIENLDIEVTELEGGRHYRIKATLTVGDKPEPIHGRVVLVTDHPEESEIVIPVAYIVPGSPPATGQLQRPAPKK
jgi:hypothetical protein